LWILWGALYQEKKRSMVHPTEVRDRRVVYWQEMVKIGITPPGLMMMMDDDC
jgi:hypothetical protein